jgi:colanic acid biosynthesis glycosyl transferase WcaI
MMGRIRSLRVTLVEQYFYPEGWAGAELPQGVAVHLAQNGFHVDVLCGSDQYVPAEGNASEDPRTHGVAIKRIPKIVMSKDIRERKWIRQAWFYLLSLPILLFRRPPDIYLAQTNPPLMPVIVACVAFVHRRAFVLVAMDIYPEVMFAHRVIRETSILGRLLSMLMKWTYRRANKVIALGPTMKLRLLEKGVPEQRIRIISNWSTGAQSVIRGSQNALAAEWKLSDNNVVLYSGNLGVAHDISTPILAFGAALKDCPSLKLIFIGSGSRLQEARGLVNSSGLQNAILFKELVPADRMPESIGLATLALVTLNHGFQGLVVPSKLLGYMSRGIPTLYIGPRSDAAELIESSGGGVVFSNEDVAGIAAFMSTINSCKQQLEEMGRNARQYYENHLSRQAGLAQYLEILESTLDPVSSSLSSETLQ